MLGLSDRVSLVGALSEEALSATYMSVDMLISASFYKGYRMAPAEGLARGLPIVAAEAVTDTVLPAAGLLVSPCDHAAPSMALRYMLGELDICQRLQEGALAAREELPRWMDIPTAIKQALLAYEVP
jgi:glycosyltransferase involved in cell wall biosynthesis